MNESTLLLSSLSPSFSDVAALHPHLRGLLSDLTLSIDGTPDAGSWKRFVAAVDRGYRQIAETGFDPAHGTRGWSAFENLFQMSPIPLMEQDYTQVEMWMDSLREKGIREIVDFLGEDVEAIRAIVPKIRLVAANPAAIEAVGIPLSQFKGPIDPGIVNEGSVPGWISQFNAVWNRIPVSRVAFKAATRAGKEYDAESILSAPVLNGEPDFSRAVLTLIDVTNHRNEERRMLELIEAKNSFLASLSHEIRTPLTAIVGFAQLLGDEESGLSQDDQQLMVSSIGQQAHEVTGLIEDLLVVARNELAEVDIFETTVNVVDQLEQTLEAGGSFTSEVVIECDPECPEALGDPGRIRQILRNLLTNAERYGGPEVRVRVAGCDGNVVVSVMDNGSGIPADDWERVFEPYQRAHV
ncbi:MAG TPA: HAMP domain-containing sensor histidine kinase, partial [Acidimicrobiia bacterium]|nr:HAMP domain-containing sensor histidine kinase [Acidimicrobiia bacterium]